MEKEIYLTQANYSGDFNDSVVKQKQNAQVIRRQAITKINAKKYIDRLPLQSYYDDKILKPGISIFKLLADIQQKRINGQYHGPHLRINIPQLAIQNQNTTSMLYSQNSSLKIQTYTSNQNFIGRILDLRQKDQLYPCCLISTVFGLGFVNAIMMKNQIYGNRIIPRNQTYFCRKFVNPYGKTPNLLRLYYISNSSKTNRKSYAQKFINNSPITDQILKRKNRQPNHYIVHPQKQESYTMTIMKGKAILQCQNMAESLVQYLQTAVKVKISQLVIDFIVDEDKIYWLHQVKAIKSKNLTKLCDIGNNQQIELLIASNNNNQMCRLCGMKYSKYEMQKILISHLQSRNIQFKTNVHIKKEGMSNVCQVCYELIVAQHKLIDIQKQFSSLLNITNTNQSNQRVAKRGQISKKPVIFSQNDYQQNGKSTPKLKAWRLFFYIQKIKNFEKCQNKKIQNLKLQMKFKHFKESFTKKISQNIQNQHIYRSRGLGVRNIQSAKLQKSNIYNQHITNSNVSYKPSSSIAKSKIQSMTTMASKVTGSKISNWHNFIPQTTTKQTFSIQKVKIFVIYTKSNQNGNLFSDTEMQFSLTLDEEVFEGRSFTLQELKNKQTCQRHSSQIFLFNKQLKYCNLQLTVGLICDGEVEQDIFLSLQQNQGIYFHPKSSSICKPLPDQWMQVFTRGQQVHKNNMDITYQSIKKYRANKQLSLLSNDKLV